MDGERCVTPPPGDRRRRCIDSVRFAALLHAPPAAPAAPAPVAVPTLGFGGARAPFAATVRGVLSAAECAAIVAETERRGYEPALLNVGGREVLDREIRDSARVIVDSPDFADAVFARIAHALPRTWPDAYAAPGTPDGWRIVGMNERLRFLRYDVGQQFKQHVDGAYERPRVGSGPLGGQETKVTVLLYLNEGYDGCFTTMYDDAGENALPVPPSTGMVLLHDHNVLHAATPLREGRKYVLRTDVFYTRET